MNGTQPDTNELLERAAEGSDSATRTLLDRHRAKLCQMIALRMDPRMAARVDPSDVVQEAYIDASRRLPDYLRDRPMPFYPWLRQIAWDRLVDLKRWHIDAQKRSVQRERTLDLPDDSVVALANRLVTSTTSPSQRLLKKELRTRVKSALDRMNLVDREVLVLLYHGIHINSPTPCSHPVTHPSVFLFQVVLRLQCFVAKRGLESGSVDQSIGGSKMVSGIVLYLEQLKIHEVAAVTGLTERGVKSRHRRALERLRGQLADESSESSNE